MHVIPAINFVVSELELQCKQRTVGQVGQELMAGTLPVGLKWK